MTVERVKKMLFGIVVTDYVFLELVDKYISTEVNRKLTNPEITDVSLMSMILSSQRIYTILHNVGALLQVWTKFIMLPKWDLWRVNSK